MIFPTFIRWAVLLAALPVPLPSPRPAVSGAALLPPAPAAARDETDFDALGPDEWLVLAPIDRRGRRPFRPDHVFERHLLDPDAAPPQAGESVTGALGREQTWEPREADERGSPGRVSGWAYAAVETPQDTVAIADLRGASTLFVNGDGFAGDVYRFGTGGVPVLLRQGTNHIYVTGIRGSFDLVFRRPAGPLVPITADVTRPDLVAHEESCGPIGLPLMNATTAATGTLAIELASHDVLAPASFEEPGLQPLEIRRLALPATASAVNAAELPPPGTTITRRVLVRERGTQVNAFADIELRCVAPGEPRRRTFVSDLDGSVQFYAERVPAGVDTSQPDWPTAWARAQPDERGTLVLTLHGAGVDALGQVKAYSAHPEAWIVAPTNRRSFGFDWQDWGRRDAYEVLALVLPAEGFDVCLTGHSMGGHGVWHLAANDPDRFLAIAPSAGWESFDTYGGRPVGRLTEVWHGADGPSLTGSLLANLVPIPTYVLHGSSDDNVPPEQARNIVAALTAAGGSPTLHVEMGAGHWWDGDRSPGADCVDWPPIFELFAGATPREARSPLSFTTMNPAVDSRHHGVGIHQLLRDGTPGTLQVSWGEANPLEVTTSNVRHLSLDLGDALQVGQTLRIDGQELTARLDTADGFQFTSIDGSWRPAGPLPLAAKGPHRNGPFKLAFDRRFVLVVGTQGTDAETHQLLARARHDAQVWCYRGNGGTRVLTDKDFLAGRGTLPSGNVILYGNADTNAAWDAVLPADGPLRVERGRVRLGPHTWEGDDLGVVFVTPRAGAGTRPALVGVFADTGLEGARLGYTLAPFVSGVGYPDVTVFCGDVLSNGDGGVLATGWFDQAWKLGDNVQVLRGR